jgi:hypothetical protein
MSQHVSAAAAVASLVFFHGYGFEAIEYRESHPHTHDDSGLAIVRHCPHDRRTVFAADQVEKEL